MVVEENNLQVQINTLRKLLGRQSISTVPGRGYRFVLALDSGPMSAAGREATGAAVGVPHNLPPERTRFIGRKAELSACAGSLEDSRLLTFTGIGGSGKTRFAIELGRNLASRYSDGVRFADLSPLLVG